MRIFKRNRSRKYPIQRDSEGKSLRARCFEMFDEGKRPKEVIDGLRMKKETVNRYFQQWKKQGPGFENKHKYVKKLLDRSTENRDQILEQLAKGYGILVEKLEEILEKPHGLCGLMKGKYQMSKDEKETQQMQVAFQLALFLNEFLVKWGGRY